MRESGKLKGFSNTESKGKRHSILYVRKALVRKKTLEKQRITSKMLKASSRNTNHWAMWQLRVWRKILSILK